ncbi:MAG: tripartite tricarboxylate transporter substrate binding protein [Sporomusaceae bacterium]|nr:tripartite tricarboxylate transporter substrate binding protein [Sporomusaceae bacterium]
MKASTATPQSEYPQKTITMIVPFSVGGGMDLLARELEKATAAQLGKPIAVINRTGGAGAIGWNELAESPADGYTLGIVGPEIVLHPLYGQSKYHYPTALEPIIQLASVPSVLAIRSSQPWSNLNDLIVYAKNHPGKLKFAHGGIGSITHIVGEMFKKSSGIILEQVPFRGGGETTAALLGDHVHLIFVGPAAIKEHVRTGTLRALAVSGQKRLDDPVLGNVPTFLEQDLDIVSDYWYAIAAPKGLPSNIKEKLAANFKTIILSSQFKATTARLGQQIDYLDAQETAMKWIQENQKYSKVVQETGITDLIKAQKK